MRIIVRVNPLGPTVTQFLIETPAGEVKPLFVEVRATLGLVCRPKS